MRDMIEHEIIPFIHPHYERFDSNASAGNVTNDSQPPEHSCKTCDCRTPVQLAEMLKSVGGALARLDWNQFLINGPRVLMMKSEDLRLMFNLSPKQAAACTKQIKQLKKIHKAAFTLPEACLVCMDAPKQFGFYPCGHVCVCSGCSQRLVEQSPKCPVCRAEIIGAFQPFM